MNASKFRQIAEDIRTEEGINFITTNLKGTYFDFSRWVNVMRNKISNVFPITQIKTTSYMEDLEKELKIEEAFIDCAVFILYFIRETDEFNIFDNLKTSAACHEYEPKDLYGFINYLNVLLTDSWEARAKVAMQRDFYTVTSVVYLKDIFSQIEFYLESFCGVNFLFRLDKRITEKVVVL